MNIYQMAVVSRDRNEKNLAQYADCTNDDELILYLLKEL